MKIEPIKALTGTRALGPVGKVPARPGVAPALAAKFTALMQQAGSKALPAADDPAGEALPAHLFLGQMRA